MLPLSLFPSRTDIYLPGKGNWTNNYVQHPLPEAVGSRIVPYDIFLFLSALHMRLWQVDPGFLFLRQPLGLGPGRVLIVISFNHVALITSSFPGHRFPEDEEVWYFNFLCCIRNRNVCGYSLWRSVNIRPGQFDHSKISRNCLFSYHQPPSLSSITQPRVPKIEG